MLGAALVLAMSTGCGEPPQPPPAAPPAAAPPQAPAAPQDAGQAPAAAELLPALVLHLGGTVEVKREGSDQWVALKLGETIRKGDAVRTSGDGQLELGIEAARLQIKEGSELRLELVEPRVVRAQVSGQMEVNGAGGERDIEIASATGAVARLRMGRAMFYADGRGQTSVAALDGTVGFDAQGRQVELKEGEFSSSRGGLTLSRPAKIPKRVSLHVNWPSQAATNKKVLRLSGRASAFARVLVQERRVEAASDGAFSADVPLKRGRQRVGVVAVDPFGHKVVQSKVITMDPDVPDIKGQVEYQ